MRHEVKIRILNAGGYPFKEEHNRTFPVIVNGKVDSEYPTLALVNFEDTKAIGMYTTSEEYPFIIGTEAEVVK